MTNDHSMAEQLSEGLANTRTFIGRSNSASHVTRQRSNVIILFLFCTCHWPCWSTDRLLRCFDGYFHQNEELAQQLQTGRKFMALDWHTKLVQRICQVFCMIN